VKKILDALVFACVWVLGFEIVYRLGVGLWIGARGFSTSLPLALGFWLAYRFRFWRVRMWWRR
jgi:hypothetical protein